MPSLRWIDGRIEPVLWLSDLVETSDGGNWRAYWLSNGHREVRLYVREGDPITPEMLLAAMTLT